MRTTNRQPKNLTVTGCLWSIVLIVLIVISLSWNGKQPPLTSDAEMIDQWQNQQSQWVEQSETCEQADTPVSLAARYKEANPLIALSSLEEFTDCQLESAGLESDADFLYVAQKGNVSLFVTDQRRKGTGWIEEKASQWSGGWVSWKSAILEEKGFIYLTQSALRDVISPLAISSLPAADITTEPLDQFVGQYRGTSQISGNSSCELWKLRPLEADTDDSDEQSAWFLFYHQARECPS